MKWKRMLFQDPPLPELLEDIREVQRQLALSDARAGTGAGTARAGAVRGTGTAQGTGGDAPFGWRTGVTREGTEFPRHIII